MVFYDKHGSRKRGVSYLSLFLGGGIVFVVVLSIWIFLRTPFGTAGQTFVVVADPMIVASWNPQDSALTIMTFPHDVQAAGTHGYGTYALEAFWRLGEIDKKDGSVLSESLSEAIGVPVRWYIGPKVGIFPHIDTPNIALKNIFSFGNIVGLLTGRYRTNIPAEDFLRFAWALHAGRIQHNKTFDFSRADTIAQDVVLADGSHQMVIDPQRLDVQLKNVFENTKARNESLTVAVYNTTDMPSLGNRVARLLGHLGVSVVAVGNDSPEVDVCVVSGRPASLKSMSAQLVISLLQCKTSEVSEQDRADLIVRMGKTYKKRFLPN